MAKSPLELTPILAAGRRQAAWTLEQLEGQNRASLHTRELLGARLRCSAAARQEKLQ